MGKKADPEKPAGVVSGVAEKTSLKGSEKKLSKPDADYEGSVKQSGREKSAGDGFTWK